MTQRFLFLLGLAAIAAPAMAETENSAICDQLAGKPGLYLVRSTEDVKRLPLTASLKLQRDIRVYVIPPPSQGNEEQVVHLRVTTKATLAADNKAETTRLRRNSVNSVCRQALFKAKKPDWDNEDDRGDTDIGDYNDFADNTSRANKNLNDWHFRWQAGRGRSNCQYTADHSPPIEGIGSKKRGKALVQIASVAEATAEAPRPAIASHTSVLVHQPNKAGSCFAFRLFQNRDAGWTPQSTRIEAWDFGEVRNDDAKRVYSLQWVP